MTANVVRRERAEWERVFAEFNRLAPANATVKQIEVRFRASQLCLMQGGLVHGFCAGPGLAALVN